MAYQCADCGNRSSKQFPGGKCPACDSFNVRLIGGSSRANTDTLPKPKASKEKKALLVLFWAIFLFGLWDNYLKDF